MHKDDRDFIDTLIAATMICFTVAIVVAVWAGQGEGQNMAGREARDMQTAQAKLPSPVPKQVQLRHFPVEGTGFECVVAVTVEDANPDNLMMAARFAKESFDWVGCYPRASMQITPMPTPVPATKGPVG